MKKFLIFTVLIIAGLAANSQYINRDGTTVWTGRMGVGTSAATTPAVSVHLQLGDNAGTKSFLLPRVNGNAAIVTPVSGMFHYNVVNQTLYYRKDAGWYPLLDSASVVGSFNTSIGTGFKVAVDGTNNIKSILAGLYTNIDSATAGSVRIGADTATMFPRIRLSVAKYRFGFSGEDTRAIGQRAFSFQNLFGIIFDSVSQFSISLKAAGGLFRAFSKSNSTGGVTYNPSTGASTTGMFLLDEQNLNEVGFKYKGQDYGPLRNEIENTMTPTIAGTPVAYQGTITGWWAYNTFGNTKVQLMVGVQGNPFADSTVVLQAVNVRGMNLQSGNLGFIRFSGGYLESSPEYGRFAATTGFLGLNTTAPTHQLTVNGQVRINNINNASVFDSVVVINNGVLEARLASSFGGAETFEQVLNNGSVLLTDHTVDVNGHDFAWDNIDGFNLIGSGGYNGISLLNINGTTGRVLIGDGLGSVNGTSIEVFDGGQTLRLINAASAGTFFQIANHTAAPNGSVITLVDNLTGQVGWSAAGGVENLDQTMALGSTLTTDRTILVGPHTFAIDGIAGQLTSTFSNFGNNTSLVITAGNAVLSTNSNSINASNSGTFLSADDGAQSSTLALTGSTNIITTSNGQGLTYFRNYGATELTNLSLVHKRYVDSLVGGGGITVGATSVTGATNGDLIINNSGVVGVVTSASVGSYLRSVSAASAPIWSTLKLPNAATADNIAYATATNTWGESDNLKFNAANNLLTNTGTQTSVTAAPKHNFNFTGDANAAFGLFAYAHDNIAMAWDAWWDGASVSYKSSHAGANFIQQKTGSRFVVSANSGITAGSVFTPTEIYGIDFRGASIQTSTNTSQGGANSILVVKGNTLTSGTGVYIESSTMLAGKGLHIAISGTAAGTGQTGALISLSGANTAGAQTTYGLDVSNTHTNTSINVAARFTSTGGSSNIAAIFAGRIAAGGVTTPFSDIDNGAGTFATGTIVVTTAAGTAANGNFSTSTTTNNGNNAGSIYNYLGSSSNVNGRIFIGGTGVTALTAGLPYATLQIGAATVPEAGSGNHTLISSLVIIPPAITNNAATVTKTSTLYIDDAPTATVTDANYAFYVRLGNSWSGGKHIFDATITAGGTTGNQTINKPSGTVNIAAAGTTVTVTNSFCTTSSIVYCVIRTADATATIRNVVSNAGNFVITLGAAATNEVSIGFVVFN